MMILECALEDIWGFGELRVCCLGYARPLGGLLQWLIRIVGARPAGECDDDQLPDKLRQ
jgi:hypothetical protein